MSIRNLTHLFKPSSIAVVGASKEPGSVGAVLARNLFKAGFEGPVMPVNPRHKAIQGVLTYPDVTSLPVTPDLAVIATPPQTVPDLIAAFGERGTKAAVVITAGFGEGMSARGHDMQRAMLEAANPHLLRIVGPNCIGVMVPSVGVNASFALAEPLSGRLAFVAQSGAVVSSVVDWASARGVGFSHLVSLGDMADVDFGDMLDYLADDPDTTAILLYVEAVTNARKFMSAARAAARSKPVIVVKAGRFPEGARAATSHTGALAGSDRIYDCAFRRAGMLRVLRLEELFDAVETLGTLRPPKGDRLGIVTNGGGIGVLATDALVEHGGRLAELAAETLAKLDEKLPPTWSHANPVDIIGDAPGSRYLDAMDALLADRGVDAVLVLNCPTAVASPADAARAVISRSAGPTAKPILTSWVGERAAAESRRLFAQAGIATYATPDQAVRAFMHVVQYRRNQELLMETPPSVPEEFTPDVERARAVIERVLADGREWLSEPESKALLAAYGVVVVETRTARDPSEAADAAAALGGPVALKLISHDVVHKSDVGGVVLDLSEPERVRAKAEEMRRRLAELRPDAKLEGFSVQRMASRAGATELIVGVLDDPQFGPLIMFGQGGTGVEVIDDQALALPPLNMHLARELMSRTRVYKLLEGYRAQPSADLDAIALALIRVAQLATDFAEIVELDVNPLLASPRGAIALDARVRVQPSSGSPHDRLAIRPYPKDLEERIPVGDGRTLLLRPILPEDEPSLRSAFAKLTPEEVRLRFFIPMKTMSHVMAARFTQIDYDRELALVLTEEGIPGTTEIYGVVHLTADPDNERAEYAIVVRHDMTGMGLGVLLMRRIIDAARKRGIREIYGYVLRENKTMLKMCRVLGFTQTSTPDEVTTVTVTLKL
jgi:acetyltransferase